MFAAPRRSLSPRPVGLRHRAAADEEDGESELEASEGASYASLGRNLPMVSSMSLSSLSGQPRRLAHPEHVGEKDPGLPFMTGNSEGHDGEEAERQLIDEQDGQDLIANLGNSGMVMVAPYGRKLVESVWLALQGFLIQAVVIYYLHKSLVPVTPEKLARRTVTRAILVASIYLHFVNCIADLPYAIQVLRHFRHIRKKGLGRAVGYPIFIIDAFCIPLVVLWVGSLYLCTSNTAVEVIFNSCAVAFISNIDNILLTLFVRVVGLSSMEKDLCGQVCVPFAPLLANSFLWSMCYVPVVPLGFTVLITHYAVDVWGY